MRQSVNLRQRIRWSNWSIMVDALSRQFTMRIPRLTDSLLRRCNGRHKGYRLVNSSTCTRQHNRWLDGFDRQACLTWGTCSLMKRRIVPDRKPSRVMSRVNWVRCWTCIAIERNNKRVLPKKYTYLNACNVYCFDRDSTLNTLDRWKVVSIPFWEQTWERSYSVPRHKGKQYSRSFIRFTISTTKKGQPPVAHSLQESIWIGKMAGYRQHLQKSSKNSGYNWSQRTVWGSSCWELTDSTKNCKAGSDIQSRRDHPIPAASLRHQLSQLFLQHLSLKTRLLPPKLSRILALSDMLIARRTW